MNCNSNGCEIPQTQIAPNQIDKIAANQTTILYVTDPICSACWAMEPAWRKLLLHYGQHFTYQYVYGGLLPKWEGFRDVGAGISQPADVAPHWEEVAQHYGQPINPTIWLNDPLASSYPQSIALHAVRLLDSTKEGAFLRKMREVLFLAARNIAKAEVLEQIAADVAIDVNAFRAILNSPIATTQFNLDLQLARRLPVRGFPTLILVNSMEQATVLHGTQPYHQLEKTLVEHFQITPSHQQFSLDEVLQKYQSGTLQELAEVLNLDKATLKRQLKDYDSLNTVSIGDDVWWQLEVAKV